jgi:tRNA-binding protein
MPGPTIDDLRALGLSVGTIVAAEPNRGARDPALKLWIDIGPGGTVQSSAQITGRYDAEALVGRQVVVVTGFEAIRVGGFRSDVLVLGAVTPDGVVLLAPDEPVAPGTPIA